MKSNWRAPTAAALATMLCGCRGGTTGAVIIGTGGDGGNGGTGTCFDGAITTGVPSDSIDDAILANMVVAGYGR